MSEITLESQLFEIIQNEELSEEIKLAKLDMLIKLGVDVNAKDESEDDITALMKASKEGLKEVVELLVANGADVNAKNNWKNSALIFASSYGYKEIVEVLVNNGALVNQKGEDDNTALVSACQNG